MRHKPRLRRFASLFALEHDSAFKAITALHKLVEDLRCPRGVRTLRHRLRLCVTRAGTCVSRLRGVAFSVKGTGIVVQTLFDALQVAAGFVIVLEATGVLVGEARLHMRRLLEELFVDFASDGDVLFVEAPVADGRNTKPDETAAPSLSAAQALWLWHWFLLGHTMKRAETPDEVDGVDPDDGAPGK